MIENLRLRNNRIEIDPVAKPKKLTATKVPQILGIGTSAMYTTPFQVWCDITGVYKKPFEESKFTRAGKEVEPKQLDYIERKYELNNLVRPEDKYENLKYTWDFFPAEKILGGKWDALTINLDSGTTRKVIECKTAQEKKRADWENGVPNDYLVQGCLYAYLLGVDGVTFVTTFLQPEDYDEPEKFVVNENNTILTPVSRSKDYPMFEDQIIKKSHVWWNEYVLTGISPKYDEQNSGDMAIINSLNGKVEQQTLF